MDNNQLLSVARQYGTPSFVFDTVELESRMREIKAIVGENVHLCYSIKANPFLLPAMAKLTEKLEVCSPGEMQICMDTKVKPETVLVSGVNKTLNDILEAVDYGVRDFTAESPLHVKLLEQAAALRNVMLSVLLRLTAGTQFGMDESDLRAAIQNLDATPHLHIVGIHYFAGTQRKKLTEHRKEIAAICELCDALKTDYGFEVSDGKEREFFLNTYFWEEFTKLIRQESIYVYDEDVTVKDLYAEYFIQEGALTGVRTHSKIDFKAEVEGMEITFNYTDEYVAKITNYGTTVVERPNVN